MTTKKETTKSKVTMKDQPKPLGQAKMLNSASIMSAATSEAFSKSMFPEMDYSELIDELKNKIEKVQAGDMATMEAMLVGQANALQTVFTCLARKAANQDYLKNYGIFMNLALKAQSQCRATIQALTELKYPKQVAFVKQANISHGHQQVNNGINTNDAPAHANENTNQSNELLEVNNGSKTMDIGATKTAIRVSKKLATVEAQHRG